MVGLEGAGSWGAKELGQNPFPPTLAPQPPSPDSEAIFYFKAAVKSYAATLLLKRNGTIASLRDAT